MPSDVRELGGQALVANAYHLALRPGEQAVRELGGLHRFLNWDGPLFTDSGAFQAFSGGVELEQAPDRFADQSPARSLELAARSRGQRARLLRADDEGAAFQSPLDGSTYRLTPERSIQIQEALGGDVMFAFDEPTSPLQDAARTQLAMERTHAWARRCLDARTREDQALYGVVQGGVFADLRQHSAAEISTLPFDGVVIAPSLGTRTEDLRAVMAWCVPFFPEGWPRHVPGVGEPELALECIAAGIDHLDGVTPTRLARHGILYTARGKLVIADGRYRHDAAPIESGCDCPTCHAGFSRGYVQHLLAANELLGYTLASLHNLRFLVRLVDDARSAILAGAFQQFRADFLRGYQGVVT